MKFTLTILALAAAVIAAPVLDERAEAINRCVCGLCASTDLLSVPVYKRTEAINRVPVYKREAEAAEAINRSVRTISAAADPSQCPRVQARS